jgi:hypothetical protein
MTSGQLCETFPSPRVAIARYPSSFNSYCHSAPAGSEFVSLHSIGGMNSSDGATFCIATKSGDGRRAGLSATSLPPALTKRLPIR